MDDGQEEMNLALETLGCSSVHELLTCLNVSRLVMSLGCDLGTSAVRTISLFGMKERINFPVHRALYAGVSSFACTFSLW